jgi:hypothetical protein
MNPVIGSWAPGEIPDFGPSERSTMRAKARLVGGSRVDPPGVFEPGPVVVSDVLDILAGDENPNPVPEYLDLDSVSTRFDQEANTVAFEQDLWGLIPKANLLSPLNYWTLVDLDNNAATGASGAQLAPFGLSTAFNGADLAMRAQVSSNGVQLSTVGQAWEFVGNQVFDVQNNGVSFSVQRDVLEPMYAAGATLPAIVEQMEMNDIVIAQVNNSVLHATFTLGAPFRVQLILEEAAANPTIWDRLDEQDQGATFVFENPQYPDAFVVDAKGDPVAGRFKPGEVVSAIASGLEPNHTFEAYLDNTIVAQGTTGPNGDVEAQFAVPSAMSPGFHTLSFVNSGTAMTAANVLEVLARADFDRDGNVDADDLGQWQGDYDLNGDSDADGDGDSDGADFLAWQRQLGEGIAVPAAAVPEPNSVVLVVMLIAARLARRLTLTFAGSFGDPIR